nr:uncharacterized protein LOC109193312 [Ipomoea trifida]
MRKKVVFLTPIGRLLIFGSVNTCDLIDSTAYGSCFTWWNGRRRESAIWMRLDKFLYTSVCESLFRTSVQHLSRATSDHYPLLVTSEVISAQPVPKHFIFLNVWTKHEDFLRVVRESWEVPIEGAPMYVLATKLCRLKNVLAPWSKETVGDIFSKLQELEDKVQVLEEVVQQNPGDDRAFFDYKGSVALLQRQCLEVDRTASGSSAGSRSSSTFWFQVPLGSYTLMELVFRLHA